MKYSNHLWTLLGVYISIFKSFHVHVFTWAIVLNKFSLILVLISKMILITCLTFVQHNNAIATTLNKCLNILVCN